MRNVYKWFRKRYKNEYRAIDINKNGVEVPMEYRREDLSKWAKEAFDAGKYYFFARPINPSVPYGKLELCEPEFEYVLWHPLSQDELNEIFGEEVYVDLKDYIKETQITN